MPKVRALLLVAFCLVLADPTHAEDWSAWQRAYDPATGTRFIPVELWTGAPWDGTQEIRMAPATLEFGRRGDKSIKGPTIWNGIQVYERLNRDKVQLLAIRDDHFMGGAVAAPICVTCAARCADWSTCRGTNSYAPPGPRFEQ